MSQKMKFEALVQQLSPKLKMIAHRLDGRYTTFTDEDLYQEAILNLWLKYGQGEVLDKTESFLVQGGFFIMKNYIRTAYKTADQMTISGTFEDTLTGREDHNFEKMEKSADCEFFKNKLTAREKIVFDFATLGLTTREIGEKIGVSHVMVGKIIKKIKIKCGAVTRT